MPIPMSTPNAVQNNQPNNPNPGAAVSGSSTGQTGAQPASFARSSKFHTEQGQTQSVASASWVSAVTQQFNVPTYGWLSMLNLTMQLTGGVKGASATVLQGADAPWNIFSNVNLTDVNGTSIWNLDGYASQLAFIWGAYRSWGNNVSQYGYTSVDQTTGGGGGTGNAKFKFQFPLEFGQDGMGCLPNMDAGAQYRLNLTYNAPSVFYNGSANQPGTVPGISTLLELLARNKAAAIDQYNNPQSTEPPSRGTIQNWTSQILTVNNGANTLQLTRTGNIVRNHIFIFRASDGTRLTAENTGVVPGVIEFDIDAGTRYKMNTDTQRNWLYELYQQDVPAGVIVFPNMPGTDGSPASEYGAGWLPTTGATKLQLQFTTTAAGTLQVITNDIIPGSGAIYSAPGMGLLV